MTEKIFVAVAWPYANSFLHLGQLAGAYIPPDIFARYHRMRANEVLMVTGSDTHGTPITVTAQNEGVSPEVVMERFHKSFCESFKGLGISYNLYTHTDTENHWDVTIDMFKRMYEKGHITRQVGRGLYCEHCDRFLADRYVEGTCPYCGFEDARGDQCDRCGKPLDALQLINPRCKFDDHTPEPRESEHFYLELGHFNAQLEEWVADKDYWRPNVLNFTNNLLSEGLHSRAITRDISWGIPVPVEGYEEKRIYVWFDAVIGYLSASIEWAKNHGQPEAWRAWWDEDADVRAYYFIGKDNIFFHTLIWPAMLMAYGGLQLPYDVPANEFLTLEGRKLSSSRNWAVWAPDYLSRYDADPIRYYLTVQAPESSDGDFSWQEFLDRNNNELVGTWGNLAHRMLTFAYKNFDGAVPQPSELGDEEKALLDEVDSAFAPVAEAIEACRFRWAVGRVMEAARAVNRYLDNSAPWKTLKSDPAKAATATYTALRAIDSLKVLFAPFLPFSSEELHRYLGYQEPMFGEQVETTINEAERSHLALVYEGQHDVDVWRPSELAPGQALGRPKPLFRKLDEEIVEQERARLG